MTKAIFAPLDHVDLAEKTYRVLKDRILKRDLSPGERISVDDVARALAVSRTPVNEALKRLASEGLIDILPRRGTFVSQLTAHEVNELFDVRLMIELYAAEAIIASGNAKELRGHVREAMDRMRRATDGQGFTDFMGFMDADRELHLQLVAMAGNEYMTRLYRELPVHVFIARVQYLASVKDAHQTLVEHDFVLEAFERGRLDEVTVALRTHITSVKSRILEFLEAHGGRL